jgi:hypothetical protein
LAIGVGAKVGISWESAKEIPNFFTFRYKKALHMGVQGGME